MDILDLFEFSVYRCHPENKTKDPTINAYVGLEKILREFKESLEQDFVKATQLYDETVSFLALYESKKSKIKVGTSFIFYAKGLRYGINTYQKSEPLKLRGFVNSALIARKNFLLELRYEFFSLLQEIRFTNYFQNDYDRIVGCSAFRRLQDKAQVFSLESFDYVRTRLTHSIEAAAIAEQLVTKINFDALLTRTNIFGRQVSLTETVKCSALLHDLGNPPFGHYGEDIIRNFFSNLFDPKNSVKISKEVSERISSNELELSKILTNPQMKSDFTCFDGNAQAFRIVNSLQPFNEKNGLNLTATVLRSIIKYPNNSVTCNEKGKFGYFYSEENIIKLLKKMHLLKMDLSHLQH